MGANLPNDHRGLIANPGHKQNPPRGAGFVGLVAEVGFVKIKMVLA